MSNYTKATNFATKDSLTTGNPLKTLSGTELDDEFNAISTASATKANANNAALTGVPVAPTAAAATSTTQVATTEFVTTVADTKLPLAGGTMTGDLTVSANAIIGLNQNISMDSDASGQLKIDGIDYNASISLDANAMSIYTNSADRDVVLGVNATQILRAKTTGIYVTGDLAVSEKLGIGTGSPTAELDVVGPASVTSFTGTPELGIVVQGSTGATDYSGIDFKGNNQTNPIARIAALTTGGGSKLQFGTSNAYASGITNTALTIDPTGNVGIGTNNPRSSLEVSGDIELSGSIFLGGRAASNQLDDYETGVFTPALNAQTSAPTVVYTQQAGTYVKIGDFVHITFDVRFSSYTGGSGGLLITNLPFANQGRNSGGIITEHTAGFNYTTGYTTINVAVTPAGSSLDVLVSGASRATAVLGGPTNHNGYLIGSASYKIA